MNYFDEDNGSDFRDMPDEVDQADAPPVNVRNAPTPTVARPKPSPERLEYMANLILDDEDEISQESTDEDEEQDYAAVLSDARLRLEQGKLYELIMNHDLFVDTGVDERAVKHVQREMRKFAQERMEIMLGMRQVTAATTPFPAEAFPFNTFEITVLKSLAAAATNGASREADAYVPEVAPPVRKALNPIARPTISKPAAPKPVTKQVSRKTTPSTAKPIEPVRRKKVDEAVQRILMEEGVSMEELNRTFPPDYVPLSEDFLEKLTPEQIAQRNIEIQKRTKKQVPSALAVPMPTQEQINSVYESRAATAASNPQMQGIMSLLLQPKKQ